jgi:hypothetical protein
VFLTRFTYRHLRYVCLYLTSMQCFNLSQLLEGVSLWKQRGRQNAEPYQVDVTAPLDRAFDEDAGGDDEDLPGVVSGPESDDGLCTAIYKVDPSSEGHMYF